MVVLIKNKKCMRLTNIAIQSILHSPGIKLELARALRCSKGTIRSLSQEKPTTTLPRAAALEVIRKRNRVDRLEKILEKGIWRRQKSEEHVNQSKF